MRAAAQVQNRDGVFRDVDSGEKIGSTDRKSARLGLAWEPSEATNAWLSLHYGKSDPKRVPRKATGRFLADNVTPCPVNNDGASQFDGTSACFARNKSGALFNPSLPMLAQGARRGQQHRAGRDSRAPCCASSTTSAR